MRVEYIVIHTAAADRRGVTVDDIRSWHRANGWSDIGYHFVVCDDGKWEHGRPEDQVGAHAKGLNDRSIGICVTGHGDLRDFNASQYRTLLQMVPQILHEYALDAERVIGHREIRERAGAPDPHKTCPGKMVDMDRLRGAIAREMWR
ncbi:MAG: N-acetylmuramoyl-L-alanine amidase [Deltaproteobacteria bacterium]|nr:N-acetylmuramoyl-L-alanine amidase [Deltaproteobacteria bacterium]